MATEIEENLLGYDNKSLCHETRALALAHAHTHAKPFRSAKNRAREVLNTYYFFFHNVNRVLDICNNRCACAHDELNLTNLVYQPYAVSIG